MGLICPRPAFLHDFWKKCRWSWLKSWEGRGGSGSLREYIRGQECPRHMNPIKQAITLTRMKIRAARTGVLPANRGLPLFRTQLQFHRQHCGVFRFARKEIFCAEIAGRRTQRQERFSPGQKVRHPKYGEGTVYHREGDGEEAKITVQFPRFGLKKLVEKYAQLERA